MTVVILAGGQGTRLWPLSRRAKPKQFCRLMGSQEMIAQCYQRIRRLVPAEDIYIALVPEFVALTKSLLPEVAPDHYLVEPCRRDSGPAMAYAALLLQRAGRGQEPALFVPTDHAIGNEDLFLRTLHLGASLVRETGKLVDIGVVPEFASTELGYTRVGNRLEERDGIEIYTFAGHKEKPPLSVAEQYIAAGDYLWHANYYMWKPDNLLQAFAQHAPDIYNPLAALKDSKDAAAAYADLPKISMDYAVTEKLPSDQVLILKGTFGWSDVGAWNILSDTAAKAGVSNPAKQLTLDAENCFVYSETDKLIATIGVRDLVIVDTPDALLICPRDRAQDVKKLVDQLQQAGHDSYL